MEEKASGHSRSLEATWWSSWISMGELLVSSHWQGDTRWGEGCACSKEKCDHQFGEDTYQYTFACFFNDWVAYAVLLCLFFFSIFVWLSSWRIFSQTEAFVLLVCLCKKAWECFRHNQPEWLASYIWWVIACLTSWTATPTGKHQVIGTLPYWWDACGSTEDSSS